MSPRNYKRMVDPDWCDVCLWWARTSLSHIEGSATGHLRFRAARLAYVLCQSCSFASKRANMPCIFLILLSHTSAARSVRTRNLGPQTYPLK